MYRSLFRLSPLTITRTATHCNILQHTATHCNTLQQSLHCASPRRMATTTCVKTVSDCLHTSAWCLWLVSFDVYRFLFRQSSPIITHTAAQDTATQLHSYTATATQLQLLLLLQLHSYSYTATATTATTATQLQRKTQLHWASPR